MTDKYDANIRLLKIALSSRVWFIIHNLKKNRSMKTFLSLAFCLLTSPVSAAVITDANFPVTSDIDNSHSSDFSKSFVNQQASSFTLSSSESVNAIRWWGVYGNGNTVVSTPDEFTIRFFEEDGSSGNPQTTPVQEYTGISSTRAESGFVHTGLSPDGIVYEYAFNLPSQLDLNAQDYWISIVNNTPAVAYNWSWSSINDIAPRWNRGTGSTSDNLSWGTGPLITGQLAYQLNDAVFVPEPSTIILFGVPLLMGVSRRNRKRFSAKTD